MVNCKVDMALNREKDIREHVFPFLDVPDNATIKYTDMYYVRYIAESEARKIELDDSGKPPATVETMPLLTIELQSVKRVSDKVLTIDIHAAYAPETNTLWVHRHYQDDK